MLLCAESAIAKDRARGLQLYQELAADTMPKPVCLAAMRGLHAAGPAPEHTNRWPAWGAWESIRLMANSTRAIVRWGFYTPRCGVRSATILYQLTGWFPYNIIANPPNLAS